MMRQALPLILHLPYQPLWSQDSADSELFSGIFSIAVPHGIHQSLVQTKFNPLRRIHTSNRFDQDLQERCQLKSGGQNEISPTEPVWFHGPVCHEDFIRTYRFGCTSSGTSRLEISAGWLSKASMRRTPRSWLTRGMCPSGASRDQVKDPG